MNYIRTLRRRRRRIAAYRATWGAAPSGSFTGWPVLDGAIGAMAGAAFALWLIGGI